MKPSDERLPDSFDSARMPTPEQNSAVFKPADGTDVGYILNTPQTQVYDSSSQQTSSSSTSVSSSPTVAGKQNGVSETDIEAGAVSLEYEEPEVVSEQVVPSEALKGVKGAKFEENDAAAQADKAGPRWQNVGSFFRFRRDIPFLEGVKPLVRRVFVGAAVVIVFFLLFGLTLRHFNTKTELTVDQKYDTQKVDFGANAAPSASKLRVTVNGDFVIFGELRTNGDAVIRGQLTADDFVGTLFTGSFQGDGQAISNLNASNLTSGTISNTLLSADVTTLGNVIPLQALGGPVVSTINGISRSGSDVTIVGGAGVQVSTNNDTQQLTITAEGLDPARFIQNTTTAQVANLAVQGLVPGASTATFQAHASAVTVLDVKNASGSSVAQINADGSMTLAGGQVVGGNTTIEGGGLTVGTSSQLGQLGLSDGTGFMGVLRVAPLSQNTVFTLPATTAATAEICLNTGNCNSGLAVTLQSAYTDSLGGNTAEIKLDSTRGGLDIQDADVSIAGSLFAVRASNGSGLGQAMFDINSQGQSTFMNSVNSTTAFQIQNSSGAQLLAVDTESNQIKLLSNNSAEPGVWRQTTPIPQSKSNLTGVTYNGYAYVIGGASTRSVHYAKVNADGSISAWASTTDLPEHRSAHMTVVANGYIYVLGGFHSAASDYTDVVYYAKLNVDGTVGSWITSNNKLPDLIGNATALVANGYVYVVGGGNYSVSKNTVYYARLNADGTTGAWQSSVSLPSNRSSTALVANGYIYALRNASNIIYYAKLNADGTTGAWQTSTNPLPQNRNGAAGVVANGYMYVIGGSDSGNQSTVYYAKLNQNGSIGVWSTAVNGLPDGRAQTATLFINGHIYVIAGVAQSGGVSSTVYYSSLQKVQMSGTLDLLAGAGGDLTNNNGAGELIAGNTTVVGTLQVSDSANFMQAVSANNGLSVGTRSNSTSSFNVQNAAGENLLRVDTTNRTINLNESSTGETGAWRETTPMPNSQASRTVIVNGYVYAFNRSLSASQHQFAKLNADGTIGAWQLNTNPLPELFFGAKVAVANGYAYIIGGSTSVNSVPAKSTVYYAKLNADGTTGAWQLSTWQLPDVRADYAVQVANNYIYVVGGRNDTGNQSTVYYARLNADGTTGAWQTSANPLPQARAHHGLSAANGYLYVVAGAGGTAGSVLYAKLNADGTTGAWQTSANLLVTAVQRADSIVSDGYIYVVGGMIGGNINTISDTIQYAKLNADGTTGAWQTSSNLLPEARRNAYVAVSGGYMYAIGGVSSANVWLPNSYYAPLSTVRVGSALQVTGAANFADTATMNKQLTIQDSQNSTQSMFVQNASGESLLRVDSANSSVYLTEGAPATLGQWKVNQSTTPVARNGSGAVIANGYLYSIGGTTSSAVYYTKLNADGTTGSWQTNPNSLAGVRAYAGVFAVNGYVYVVGGQDGSSTPQDSVYYARLNQDGTTGPWQTNANLLPQPRSAAGAVMYNGYIYLVGGSSTAGAQASTLYARVLSNGTIGPWQTAAATLANNRVEGMAAAHNGYLYLMGGSSSALTYYAPINADGSHGAWTSTTSLPLARTSASSIVVNGHVYMLGGNSTNTVYYAKLNQDGTIGTWVSSLNTLAYTVQRTGVAVGNGYVYLVGGQSGSNLATTMFASLSSVYVGTSLQVQNSGLFQTTNTAALQVQNASGATVFNVDSANRVVSVGAPDDQATLFVLDTKTTAGDPIGVNGAQYYNEAMGRFRCYQNNVWTDCIGAGSNMGSGDISQGGNSFAEDVTIGSIDSYGINFITNNQKVFSLGNTGNATFQASADSSTAFQIQNTAGSNLLRADTVSKTIHLNEDSSGETGPWVTGGNSMPNNKTAHSSIVANGYIYVVGGSTRAVYYAKLNPDGSVGTWVSSPNSLPEVRAYAKSVAANGYLYVLGGSSTANTTGVEDEVYYAKLNNDGSVGSWQTNTYALPTVLYTHASVVANGYVYAIGGHDGTERRSTVYYAKLNVSGGTGPWQTATSLPASRQLMSAIVANGYLHVIGGNSGATDYYAKLNTDGSVGTWQVAVNNLPTARQYTVVLVSGQYAYAIPGSTNGSSGVMSVVHYARLQQDGTIGPWQASAHGTPFAQYNHAAATSEGYLYLLGGSGSASGVFYASLSSVRIGSTLHVINSATFTDTVSINKQLTIKDSQNSTQSALIQNAAGENLFRVDSANNQISLLENNSGEPGTWSQTVDTTAVYGHASVVVNGYGYIIGGRVNGITDVVRYAKLNADGTTGAWLTTSSLPSPRSSTMAVASNGYIYAIGGITGNNNETSNAVTYAKVNSDGTLGAWRTNSNALPIAGNMSGAVANGFIYAVAGYGNAGGIASLQYAKLNADGSVGSWQVSAMTVRHQHGVVVANGYLYAIGGTRSDVQYAKLNADGSVGPWQTSPNTVPAGMLYRHNTITSNGYIYIIGGQTGLNVPTTNQSNVYYSRLNSDGSIGSWQTAVNSLPGARESSSSVFANGYIYTIGGRTTAGLSATTVYYSNLQRVLTSGTLDVRGQLVTTDDATIGGGLSVAGPADFSQAVSANNGLSVKVQADSSSSFSVQNAVGDNLLRVDTQNSTITLNEKPVDGETRPWQISANTLPSARATASSVTVNGHVYIMGGSGSRTVTYAKLNADGTTGAWQTSPNLVPDTRSDARAVALNGYIYIMQSAGSSTTAYTKVSADGSIGPWQTTAGVPWAHNSYYYAATQANGYIYVSGGYSVAGGGLSAVYYAKPAPDGTISSWQSTTSLPGIKYGHSMMVRNGYVYVIGGSNTSTLSAKIGADGSVGSWQVGSALPGMTYLHSAVQLNEYIYVMGGQHSGNGSPVQTVYYAKVNADSSMSAWTLSQYQLPRAQTLAVGSVHNNYIYFIGGYDGTVSQSSVFYTTIPSVRIGSSLQVVGAADFTHTVSIGKQLTVRDTENTTQTALFQNATGGTLFRVSAAENLITLNEQNSAETGSWQISAETMPWATATHASVTTNGYVYVIRNVGVAYAKLQANGNTGPWQLTQALPVQRSYHSAVVANGYVYVIGGSEASVAMSSIYYAKLNADGTLGAWQQGANTLPQAVTRHTSVTLGGYVYVFGGFEAGAASRNVYYAKLNQDGSIGSWQTGGAGALLPNGRYVASSVVANGYVYVIGGSNGGSGQTTVFYAKPNSDGSITGWQSSTNTMPAGRNGASAVVANGYVYVLGGALGSTYFNTTYYAKLNQDGSTGTWYTAAEAMAGQAVSNAAAVIANGYIYVTGGGVNSSGLNVNTVQYTSLQRVRVSGTLDLVGNAGGDLVNNNGSGELIAGNTNVVGTLQLQGDATFNANTAIKGDLSVGGNTHLAGGATVSSTAPADTTMTVKTMSGQTGDAIAVKNATGTTMTKVDSDGNAISYGTNTKLLALAVPTITTISTGSAYYYAVTAYNAQGETVKSNSVGMVNNTSGINWNAVPGATGYKLYRATTNDFTASTVLLATIANSAIVSYVDTGSTTVTGTPPVATTGTGLTLQAWSGQAGSSLAIQNPAGAMVAGFRADGSLFFANNGYSTTLNTSSLTANRNLLLPDVDGVLCTTATCGGSGGPGGNYITNGTSLQQGNFAIQSASPSSVGGLIRGANGQSGDLLQLQNNTGGTVTSFSPDGSMFTAGNLTVQGVGLFGGSVNSTAALAVQGAGAERLFTVDSVNRRVYVGNPSGDTTAVLVVLSNVSTVNDPAGIPGAMYYNAIMQRFRCYQGTAWFDCITQENKVFKTSDQTIASNTYTDVTQIGYSVAANRAYSLKCSLLVSVAGNGGNLSMNGPAGISRYIATFMKVNDQSSGDNMVTSNIYDDPNAATNFRIVTTVTGANIFIMDYNAILTTGPSAGTWQLRAKAANSSSITLYGGSSCGLRTLD